MEIEEAVKIVRALASSVDPETGNALEEGSLYRKPQIVKALNRALGALVQMQERQRNKPVNAGRYWSHEEDAQVCEELKKGLDFQQIAKSHNRSVSSIVARLVKLGKIVSSATPKKASRGAFAGRPEETLFIERGA